MQHGMAYVHIPVVWEAPCRADLEKFFHFFGSYHQFKTYVHCIKNMRVSAFLFLFRTLVEKKEPESCLLDLLTIWKPNPVWQNFMDEMLMAEGLQDSPMDWRINWDQNTIERIG